MYVCRPPSRGQPEPEPRGDDAPADRENAGEDADEDAGEGEGGPLVESQVPGGMETPTKRPHRVPPLDTRPMPAIEDEDKLADDLLVDAQTEGLRSRAAAEQPTTKAGDFLYVQRELLPTPRQHRAACPPLSSPSRARRVSQNFACFLCGVKGVVDVDVFSCERSCDKYFHVECVLHDLLCTVTFYANHARNLTRSP